MPTAYIVLTQGSLQTQPGYSTDQLVLETVVVLSNSNNTGVTAWFWQFTDLPQGSSAVISTPTSPTAAFTPDLPGTYLIRLNINGGTQWSQVGGAVKTLGLKYRIPAITEEFEFDNFNTNQKGWGPAINNALNIIDDGYVNYGSGADGYIALWNNTKTLTGSPNLTFDDTYFISGTSGNQITSIFWGSVGILDNIDTFGPSSMGIGSTNATSINIAQPSISTNILGNLVISNGQVLDIHGDYNSEQTAQIAFNGSGDTTWRMGRDLGLYTKTVVTSNSLDIGVYGGTDGEGLSIGQGNGGTSILELVGNTKQAYFAGNIAINGSGNFVQFNGPGDTNWRQGVDLGAYTKQTVSNSMDIVVGAGSSDGFTIGNVDGLSMFELKSSNMTGYLATSLFLQNSSSSIVAFNVMANSAQTAHTFELNRYGSTGGDMFCIDNNGNVGINTISPSVRLEVDGQTWIRGVGATLQVDDVATFSSNVNGIGTLTLQDSSSNFSQLNLSNTGTTSYSQGPFIVISKTADGPSAKVIELNTFGVSWSDPGARLLSVQNNSIEKFSVDAYGNGYFSGNAQIDGYTFDISSGASVGQILIYDGTKFSPSYENLPEFITTLPSPGVKVISLNTVSAFITTSGSNAYENILLPDGQYNGQLKIITFLTATASGDHILISGTQDNTTENNSNLFYPPNSTDSVDLINQGDSVEYVWYINQWFVSRFTGAADYD